MRDMTLPAGDGRVAILGGSFDPIHWGHLALAEQVGEYLGLRRVLFMPSGQPPHKPGRRLAPAEDRYQMTLLATRGNPRLGVSRLELDRPGPSYTLDTLRALKAQPNGPAEVLFILGADQVLELPTWYRAAEVMAEARFITVPRPGYDLEELPRRLGGYAAQVAVLPLVELDISASGIRARLAAGQSIRYLVPDLVADYIHSRGLYQAVRLGGPLQEPSALP